MKRTSFVAATVATFMTLSNFAWASGEEEGAADQVPEIELMFGGWVNQPTDENDPFRAYLNETFGVDITMNNTAEFNNEILTRFATNDPPDIVKFSAGAIGEAFLTQLYDEGFLLSDWNEYASSLPTWMEYMDDYAEDYLTRDGKLTALSTAGPPNIWGFQIRKDWLANLGLEIPTTADELMSVARAFTYDDPDGNGEDDTWALTSAGNGQGVGEIRNLKLMWGPTDFYIADGQASHYVVDGTEHAFLDFMRAAVAEGVIEPNWYTIAWNERKAPLFQGVLGTAWYPGVLVTEFVNEGGRTVEESVDLWTHLPMPKGRPEGGRLAAPRFFDRMFTLSRQAEEDPVKLERTLALIDGVAYPNPGYYAIRWGVGIDRGVQHELPGGYTAIIAGPGTERYRSVENFLGAADWGNWMSTRADFTIFTPATSADDLPATVFSEIELNNGALAEETYAPDAYFLHLDQSVVGELDTLVAEFEYKYIIGETDDYAGFMNEWLAAGGQELLDEATRQFKALGMIQ